MSPNDPTTPAPTPAEDRPIFDAAVMERLKRAFLDVFVNHPEVKTLSASVGWMGGLNDAKILHGIWLASDGGAVNTADGIVVSLTQTLKLFDEQLARGLAFVQSL